MSLVVVASYGVGIDRLAPPANKQRDFGRDEGQQEQTEESLPDRSVSERESEALAAGNPTAEKITKRYPWNEYFQTSGFRVPRSHRKRVASSADLNTEKVCTRPVTDRLG